MNKLKTLPRVAKEIILTIASFVGFWAIWSFIAKDSIVLSDQGLSTIGIALSTSTGVLTAIVVSFVLITWQSSRQERSKSFWRWRNALLELSNYFDANVEVLAEITRDVMELTLESAAVALISPMPRNKFKELSTEIWNKITKVGEAIQNIKAPSKEELLKGRAYRDITNHLVYLTTANFEHNISHYLYRRVLSLRGLLYRLLVVLLASILVVVLGATTTSIEIPDVFNTPLAIVLIGWVTYMLICLGREIRRVSLLEDEFHRQEEV